MSIWTLGDGTWRKLCPLAPFPHNCYSSKQSDHANRTGNQAQVTVSNTVMGGALPPKNSLSLYLEVFCTVIRSIRNRIQHVLGINSHSEGSYDRIFPRFYWSCTFHDVSLANIFVNRYLLSSGYMLSNTLNNRIYA